MIRLIYTDYTDDDDIRMKILKYHVLSGRTSSFDLPITATSLDTLSPNSKLSVKNTAPQVSTVDGSGTATVIAADVMVSNMPI